MVGKYSRARIPQKHAMRISMSLPPALLSEFDKTMKKAGFSDRSKAIQKALHSFIDEYDWKAADNQKGAGAIIMLYDNQSYNQDLMHTRIQHHYSDIISANTHLHLDHDNCLETVMVRGEVKRMKELAKHLLKKRGVKSLKIHFVALI